MVLNPREIKKGDNENEKNVRGREGETERSKEGQQILMMRQITSENYRSFPLGATRAKLQVWNYKKQDKCFEG